MNNLNSILIEGDLIRDPQIRTTPKGTVVTQMTLASCHYYKNDSNLEKEVCFFDIETWGKLAEQCASIGRKGRGVRVVGRLKQDRWNDADGKPHTRIVIVAEHCEFRPQIYSSALGAVTEPPLDGEYLDESVIEEAAETVA